MLSLTKLMCDEKNNSMLRKHGGQ